MPSYYYLEIYGPDSDYVAGEYMGETPFPPMHIGEAIQGNALNKTKSPETVRIKDLQHIIWELDGRFQHKLCVYTTKR